MGAPSFIDKCRRAIRALGSDPTIKAFHQRELRYWKGGAPQPAQRVQSTKLM